ncbi:MAG TPA: PilZ domain-containing protein [Bdellovibrionales bacterium]|nr:PilZ domain-containing protein [Bdellovibrionales bacterium]
MTKSNRKHFRHKTQIDAMVRVRGNFTWIRSKVHNLSRGGILLQAATENVLVAGDSVEVEFTTVDGLGRTNQRRFNGKVAWRRGTRYGIEFQKKSKS